MACQFGLSPILVQLVDNATFAGLTLAVASFCAITMLAMRFDDNLHSQVLFFTPHFLLLLWLNDTGKSLLNNAPHVNKDPIMCFNGLTIMYLFFDTETTGLPKSWKAPVSDIDNWPRLVQLAWLSFDSEGNRTNEGDFIVRPEGFIIPDDSARIHGISTERALAEGLPLAEVLARFSDAMTHAETLVAHNMSFDEKIMGAEFLRLGVANDLEKKPKICTMQSAVEFCALEGQYGYKWPKLTELHLKLFGTGFEEAHNAAVDISATAKCFFEMKRLGLPFKR